MSEPVSSERPDLLADVPAHCRGVVPEDLLKVLSNLKHL